MSKTYLPYEPDQQLLLPAACRSGCLTTIWPTSYPTWWTSWTCRRSPLATSGTAWRAAVSSTDDGQGAALRLLRRGGVLTPHRPASPRGHRLQGVGGEQHTGLPDHLRLSQGQSGCAVGPVHTGTGVVPAGGAGEAGARGAGRHEGQGQRIEA